MQDGTEANRVLINPQMHLVKEARSDRRCHILATAEEVTAILIGEECDQLCRRDFQLRARDTSGNPSGYVRIAQNHGCYLQRHKVLLFSAIGFACGCGLALGHAIQNADTCDAFESSSLVSLSFAFSPGPL